MKPLSYESRIRRHNLKLELSTAQRKARRARHGGVDAHGDAIAILRWHVRHHDRFLPPEE